MRNIYEGEAGLESSSVAKDFFYQVLGNKTKPLCEIVYCQVKKWGPSTNKGVSRIVSQCQFPFTSLTDQTFRVRRQSQSSCMMYYSDECQTQSFSNFDFSLCFQYFSLSSSSVRSKDCSDVLLRLVQDKKLQYLLCYAIFPIFLAILQFYTDQSMLELSFQLKVVSDYQVFHSKTYYK